MSWTTVTQAGFMSSQSKSPLSRRDADTRLDFMSQASSSGPSSSRVWWGCAIRSGQCPSWSSTIRHGPRPAFTFRFGLRRQTGRQTQRQTDRENDRPTVYAPTSTHAKNSCGHARGKKTSMHTLIVAVCTITSVGAVVQAIVLPCLLLRVLVSMLRHLPSTYCCDLC